jgi:hypothetical protein
MRTTYFLKWVIFLMLFLGCLLVGHLCTSTAQTAQEPPKVSLKMFIVPEIEACPPNGYKDYDSGQASNCPTLGMEDINKWEDSGIMIQTGKIPPGEILLGKFLFTSLDNYSRRTKKDGPEERLSFVLVFEWDQPQNSPITLERKGCPNIPSMKWSGELKDYTNWIHHERADAFLPANNIKWTLKEAGYKWVFKAER